MKNDLKIKLYEKYGAFSKKYANIMMQALTSKTFTLSELSKKTGYSFKMITTLVNNFDNIFNVFNNTYSIKIEYKQVVESLFNKPLQSGVELNKIEENIANIKSAFTNHKPNIDHVACTAKTALNRAIKLNNDFDVENCNILFLGDHDLTSIALKLINNKANITVVDVDNDVLGLIDEFNNDFNSNITTVFNDFLLPQPKGLEGVFDVVFTDPPYTPVGMDLFIKRALYFLNKNIYSTILCAYGSAEQSNTVGYNVQRVFYNNYLYTDEILLKFNEYDAAEALGYRADLYVMRPTPNAWKKNKLTAVFSPTIYTHGVNSLESGKIFDEFVINNYKNNKSLNKILLTNDVVNNSKNIKVENLLTFLANSYNNKKVYDDIFVSLQNLYSYSYDQIVLMLSANNIHLFISDDILNDGNKTTLLKQLFEIKKVNTEFGTNYFILTKNKFNKILLNFYNNKIAKSINAFANILINGKTKNELREVFNNSPIGNYKNIQAQFIPTNKLIKFNKYITKHFNN